MSPQPPTTTDPTAAPASTAPAAATGLTSQTDPFGLGGSTATTAPTSATPIYPGSSLSPYFMSQIGSQNVTMGAGLGTSGTMTINQAVEWFQKLPRGQLLQIEQWLEAAGFYTDANGNPLTTAPALGTLGDQSNRAFLNAIISAAQTGQSVTDTIQSAIQSGAGANNRSTLPSAVTGGGNEYNIDLTNPENVAQSAVSVFQQALGRNPTQAEIKSITAALQSQETSQGLAQEQGSEQSAQEHYQTSVNQRNTAYQFETTPKVALGAVPNGPFSSPEQEAITVLQYLGSTGQGGNNIVTASNVQFLAGWIKKAGPNLGVQNTLPGSTPGANGPQFASTSQGIEAVVQTLLSGPYSNIVASIMQGDASQSLSNSDVQAELKKWSNGAFSTFTAGDASAANKAIAASAPPAQTTSTTPAPSQGMQNQINTDQEKSGGLPTPAGQQAPMSSEQQAIQSTMQQGATNPQVGAYLTASYEKAHDGQAPPGLPGSSTPAADVNPGQVESNPGDQYIGPVTTYTTNPATEAGAEYNAATTGPNRIAYGANNYLNAFNAVVAMIKNGGPNT